MAEGNRPPQGGNEPDAQSDADKIRLKRLAKMQAATSAPPSSTSTPVKAAPLPKKVPVTPAATPAKAAPAPTPAQPQSVPFQRFSDTFEEWQDQTLGQIFGVTLNRDRAGTSSDAVVWLGSLHQELLDDNEDATHLREDIIDRVLLARLSTAPTSTNGDVEMTPTEGGPSTFEYLVGCWKRCNGARSALVNKKGADADEYAKRLNLIEAARALIISYAGLTLQDPSMFPQPSTVGPLKTPPGYTELVSILLNPDSSLLLPDHLMSSFVTDLTKRFADDGLEDIFGPVIRDVCLTVLSQKQTMAGLEWRPSARAITELVENKQIAAMLPNLPTWAPQCAAQAFEILSLIGPLVRLGCFGDSFPEVRNTWFQNAAERNYEDMHSTLRTLRGTLTSHQDSLFRIFNAIVRSSPVAREAVVAYWARIIKDNEKRSGSYFDPRIAASHSFTCNLHTVLLHFTEPFVDPTFSKIDKVDVNYFRHSDRLDVTEDTKLHATLDEWKQYKAAAPADATAPNFITEIFFLTNAFFHLGLTPAFGQFEKYQQSYHRVKRDYDELKNDQSWVGTPQEEMAKKQLEDLKRTVERYLGVISTYEVQLLDPVFIERLHYFCSFSMAWLIRVVDPHAAHPQRTIELPLPEKVPDAFAMLPEYLFEDIVTFYENVSKFCPPDVLAKLPLDQLLNFIIVFLSSPLVKNPYLKGKMVDVLYYNTRPTQSNRFGALGDTINVHSLSLNYLVSALIRIYIDIETTGTHTQFYDKFYTRNHIASIFRVIWMTPQHRDALKREAKNVDKFVRFINLLLNDATFLLDESLNKLQQINELQKLKSSAEWETLSVDAKQEKDKKLSEAESSAKSYCGLANETLRMLSVFSEEAPEPFVRAEIVDRLASMLDFNLDLLAGPKCQTLKVAEPKKYSFKPRDLLRDLVQVYLNLASREEFCAAVARDERSYKRELFVKAERIAFSSGLKTEAELQGLRTLVDRVEVIKAEEAADDEAGEVPDEFLDPLTYTIMRDPVVLPKGKQRIDRSSIVQHLLSDPRDPFTSTPLTVEECLPDAELRAQIENFIRQRREDRRAKQASAMDTEPPAAAPADAMDMT